MKGESFWLFLFSEIRVYPCPSVVENFELDFSDWIHSRDEHFFTLSNQWLRQL